jgi:hypothetical protein
VDLEKRLQLQLTRGRHFSILFSAKIFVEDKKIVTHVVNNPLQTIEEEDDPILWLGNKVAR